MIRFLLIALTIGFCSASHAAWKTSGCASSKPKSLKTQSHVRVLLDTSKSMSGYGSFSAQDPGRLAKMSTLLLNDLVFPNSSDGDTFGVMPFVREKVVWSGEGAAPNVVRAPRQYCYQTSRSNFVRALSGSRFNYASRSTYFYPYLSALVRDLEKRRKPDPSSRNIEQIALAEVPHRKLIVLITDGLSDATDKEAEQQQLQQLFAQHDDIYLYIITFGDSGDEANQFFGGAFAGNGRVTIATAKNAGDLADQVQTLFQKQFGYESTSHLIKASNGRQPLGLTGSAQAMEPEQVALVKLASLNGKSSETVYRNSGAKLSLTGGASLSKMRQAKVAGGAYSLRWYSGQYSQIGVERRAEEQTVIALRKVEHRAEIVEKDPGGSFVPPQPGPLDVMGPPSTQTAAKRTIYVRLYTGQNGASRAPKSIGARLSDSLPFDSNTKQAVANFRQSTVDPNVYEVDINIEKGDAGIKYLLLNVEYQPLQDRPPLPSAFIGRQLQIFPFLQVTPRPIVFISDEEEACRQIAFAVDGADNVVPKSFGLKAHQSIQHHGEKNAQALQKILANYSLSLRKSNGNPNKQTNVLAKQNMWTGFSTVKRDKKSQFSDLTLCFKRGKLPLNGPLVVHLELEPNFQKGGAYRAAVDVLSVVIEPPASEFLNVLHSLWWLLVLLGLAALWLIFRPRTPDDLAYRLHGVDAATGAFKQAEHGFRRILGIKIPLEHNENTIAWVLPGKVGVVDVLLASSKDLVTNAAGEPVNVKGRRFSPVNQAVYTIRSKGKNWSLVISYDDPALDDAKVSYA